MAFFGSSHAYLGIDIGTSSLKIVELVDRRRRIEVSTYAQANIPNLLLHPEEKEAEAIRETASILSRMIDQAGVSTDQVIAALPSSSVFSTVVTLPDLPDDEIAKAVRFSARDIVPADLEDMVLGWSKVGAEAHMETDRAEVASSSATSKPSSGKQSAVPVFITAAPKEIVSRYSRVIEALQIQLNALEVETFPLVRSLLEVNSSALIVDIGDRATTLHIVDRGTPYVSQSIEIGGYTLTERLSKVLGVSEEEAEAQKIQYGLSGEAPTQVKTALQSAMQEVVQAALRVTRLYEERFSRRLQISVLIGGGANLKNLSSMWAEATGHKTVIGNPWKGLSYPAKLDNRLQQIGPTYAVAVGLALRGVRTQPIVPK